jgi:hypothetical protein
MSYKIKDRSKKLAKRRNAMPVNGRSVFTLVEIIGKKAAEAKAKRMLKRPD